MTDTKPKCLICNHNHNPDEEHIWFGSVGDFEVSAPGEVNIDPEPVKKIETTKEPRKSEVTRSKSAMNWRKKNPEKYRAYMRNYMQKWRAAKE